MCFPNKHQKSNFEEQQPSSQPQQPTQQESTSSAPPPPATASTTAITTTAMAPKVAIVIYSMYGHVAKRMYFHRLIC
jgi:NAD(P)H dehydrogenase (quinone)